MNVVKTARLLGCLMWLVSHVAHAQTCGRVKTSQGILQGVCGSTGVISFKGIPYAQPPTGELRWKPPLPPSRWQGIREADAFGASCIQNIVSERLPWSREFMTHGSISEDCLYLNVWTPRSDNHSKRPVYVFIHGGGFVEGSGAVDVYDGTHLAEHEILVVTINYRLGALGFLAHPELTAESAHHSSGNYGLLDAVAALAWIQTNISNFGGDPQKVTIGGQSAGSFFVHDLTASPLAKGLFWAAIAESGGSGLSGQVAMKTLREAEQEGEVFAKLKASHSLKELRDLPATDFIFKAPSAANGPRITRPAPIVDGWFLPESVEKSFAEGKQNDVATLAGMQADEDSSAPTYGRLTAGEMTKQAQIRYGALEPEFIKLYLPPGSDAAETQKLSARDRGLVSMYLWASNTSKTNRNKLYTYYFARGIPWPEHPEFAAFHTSELVYDLDNLDKLPRPFTSGDKALSNLMTSYWVNFIKTRDPNAPGLPVWKPFSAATPETMGLDLTSGTRPIASPEVQSFWTKFFSSPMSSDAPIF